jgi:hypothetical protein
MTVVLAENQVDREIRDGDIVRARLDGATYKEIAQQTGLSISQCHRVYEAARARRRGDYDLEQHRTNVSNDIDDLLDYLRPFVMGEPVPDDVIPPPTMNLIGDFLKALKAKRELLALDAPKRSQVMTQEVREEPVNQQAAEYLARLAIWARQTNAINVNGYNPALPPGMTERVNVNGHTHIDGHDPGRPQGKGMWSTVLENPSED